MSPDAPILAPDADEAIRRLRRVARENYDGEMERAQRGMNDAIYTLTELLGDIDDDGQIASTLKTLAQARGSLRWLSVHGGRDPDKQKEHEARIRAEYEAGELPVEPTVDSEGADHDRG